MSTILSASDTLAVVRFVDIEDDQGRPFERP
jgi:hypothetical protein